MRAKRVILSAIDKHQWATYLSIFAKKGIDDIYFHPEYISLYAKHLASVEAYVYQDGENCFFLPYIKGRVNDELSNSLVYDLESAYGYGGPLSTTEEKGFLNEAWDDFFGYCKHFDIIAGFIRFHPLLQNNKLVDISRVQQIVWSNQIVILDLDKSQEQVWQNYTSNTRNKIRKSKKGGTKIISGNNMEDLKVFQKLYYETMNQIIAEEFYYFDRSYFENIFNNLRDNFKVYLAKINDVNIGGVLVLFSQNFVYYHLSANIKKYRSFEPATLLRHEVIVSNLRNGRKSILFGGGRSGDNNDSLFKFKAGFSKERADFYIGKFLFDKKIYQRVCQNWEKKYPEKVKTYKNYFLKYRF